MPTETEKEDKEIIDLVFNFKLRKIQDFLREKDLFFSGDRKKVKKRLISYRKENQITKQELTLLLKELEEYGNQTIFLFDLSTPDLELLDDVDYFNQVIEENNLQDKYDNYDPIFLSESPKISHIEYGGDLKIRWGAKKIHYDLLLEDERVDEDTEDRFLWKKFAINLKREIALFQVSLVDGQAELLIPTSTGRKYVEEKNKYLNEIRQIFGINPIQVNLNNAISNLYDSNEIRSTFVKISTAQGSGININSPSKNRGIRDDPDAENTKDGINQGTTDRGEFYWIDKQDNPFDEELCTRFYENYFSVVGERTALEVNHVIRRIRFYNRG